MTFEQYQKLSIRTLPKLASTYDLDHIINTFGNSNITDKLKPLPELLDSIHMVMGMTSELVELFDAFLNGDKVNISEELADILWYVSGELHIINKPSLYEVDMDIELDEKYETGVYFNFLVCSVSEYSDLIKKHFAYRKIIIPQIRQDALQKIFLDVLRIAKSCNVDLNQALQNNIDKLIERFGDKFNEEDALNRNLKAERKELEK